MILVFGGTTEGKKTAAMLEQMGLSFLYSTKTKIDFDAVKHGEYRHGALDDELLSELVNEKNISTIIYAAHPFAEILTETVERVSQKTKVPVWYVEREQQKRLSHPLVHYVTNYKEAEALLKELNVDTLLALTGVQSIQKLEYFWKNKNAYFRILDRDVSRLIAKESGISEDKLILGYPSRTVEDERSVLKEYGCDAILTKESGKSGYLDVKVDAAIEENIPIVIIKKPSVPALFNTVGSVEELKENLLKISEV